MTSSLRPLAIAVALFVAATTFEAAESPTVAFALGIVRRDGALIPFAAFDGKRWSSNWPPPRFDLEIPINLQSTPKNWWGPTGPVTEWRLWPAGGASAPRAIRVVQPDWVDAHCVRQVVLKTDYRSDRPMPSQSEQPFPKDGLAISSALPLEPIEVNAPVGLDKAVFASELREKFNDAEDETASRFGEDTPRRVREAMEPVVEALYAFGDNPRTYYVEASREYRGSSPGDCRVAFATGWFTRQDVRVKWLDMVVDLLPCSRYGATYMLPLGVVHASDRTFWVAQYSGWDHERYVVIEIKKDKVEAVVSAWGGGC